MMIETPNMGESRSQPLCQFLWTTKTTQDRRTSSNEAALDCSRHQFHQCNRTFGLNLPSIVQLICVPILDNLHLQIVYIVSLLL